jgi:cellulose synthase/poly-beta-1,6-N-acetylglucosamine synthase-like glycosyltransferase
VDKCERYEVEIVEKDYRKWRNSYAESLQLGLNHAKGKYIAIIDMDIIIPLDFFGVLLPMIRGNVASVAPMVSTYPSGVLNSIVSVWQKTYKLAPVGRGTYGIRIVLKDALDEISGFKDVLAVDTDVDLRLERKGVKSIFTPLIKVYHMRRETWNSIVKKQIRAGQSRRMIRYGLLKTLAHAVFRLRPFVIAGWIIGGGERK